LTYLKIIQLSIFNLVNSYNNKNTLVLLKIFLVIRNPKCLKTTFDAQTISSKAFPITENLIFFSIVFFHVR